MPTYKPEEKFIAQDSLVFDLEICDSLLNFVSSSTGFSVALFDTRGNQISAGYNLNSFCETFLNKAQDEETIKKCLECHKKVFQEVLETAKPSRSTCPMNLRIFAVPVADKSTKEILGVISGGQILADDPATLPKKVLSSLFEEQKKLLNKIPVLDEKSFNRTLKSLSDHVAKLTGECYEKQALKKKVSQFAFASEIAKLVAPDFDLNSLLHAIAGKVTRILDVDGCGFNIWDPVQKTFTAYEANLFLPLDADKIFTGKTLAPEITGQPLVINDPAREGALVQKLAKKHKVRSLMYVPLQAGKKFIGLMHVFNTGRHQIFTEDDVDLAGALTAEVALAIESTRLYEESKHKAEELAKSKEQMQSYFTQIGTALTSALNLGQLLRLIVEMSMKLVHADGGSLYLLEGKKPSTQVAMGLERIGKPEVKYRMRESLIGGSHDSQNPWAESRILSTGETIYEDTASREEIKSYLGVPLTAKDKMKGLLNIYTRDKREFQPEEVELLAAFASHAALAIENAQIFESEQRKAKEATTLYVAARAIGQSLALNDVLSLSAQQLCRSTEVDRCIILLIDEKIDELYTASTYGLTADQENFFSFLRLPIAEFAGNLWENIKQGKPLILTSAPPDCPALQKFFGLLPSNSCIIIPLFTREQLMGIIYLDDSRAAHHFTQPQVRLVMTLAIQIATAIQRAKLVFQLEENFNQLSALYQISTAVTGTLSLNKLFNLIVDKVSQLMENISTNLLIFTEETNQFLLEASIGSDPGFMSLQVIDIITGLMIKKKRPMAYYITEENKDEPLSHALTGAGLDGILSIPLISKRKVIGILNCFAREGYQFSPQRLRLLRAFANHAVIAMENARLYEIIKNKVHELATLFEVGKAITSTLQFEKVLDEIAENVIKAMKADACSIMLLDHNTNELTIKSAKGLEKNHIERKVILGEGVSGIAAKTGKPMILLDMKEEASPYKFPKELRKEGLKTILSVSGSTKNKTIGLVNVYKKDIYYHTQPEINLLGTMANQSAIAIENARLYSEQLEIAKIIRSSLVPQQKIFFPGLDIGHKYIPSMELSGDYYDLVPIDENKMGITISDVAGKGTSAAIYTARAKYVLKSFAFADYPPEEVLTKVNQILEPETEREKFISLFYGKIDLKNKEVVYSVAGHEPPILWKTSAARHVLLEGNGLLIGVEQGEKYTRRKASLESGDFLVLYTDGITEARSPEGKLFGIEGVIPILEENSSLSAQAIANKIHTTVQKFTRKKLTDDFTLLVIKII
ncbi:MAG: GAF domain-containing protein [Firmicutes bacterium]|nr:GAF domain-containing protein [Bacillota bacterium]